MPGPPRKKPSVSVGYINGRVWAKCWSRGCGQADILAALGIATSKKNWEVQKGVTGSVARMSAWPHPRDRPRPTFSVDYLPPVSPNAGVQYLEGILRPSGSAIQYQRDDGQRGKHWRNPDMRRNPGVTGDGWQLRRFDPIDPASATAICLAEGEKDAAILATAGLIAFTAPRGAQSLPLADFTELVDLAKAKAITVLLCGDNDEPGREAMRKVSTLLKKDHHLDTTDVTSLGPEKGSVADLPAKDLQALIRIQLSDPDPRWQKPIRTRKQYLEFRCGHRKRNIKKAGDLSGIWGLVSCGNTATCKPCGDWENFLHIERCWRGRPAQMLRVSGFGEVGSTIAETVGAGKVYRGHLEDRLREKPAVDRKVNLPSSERRVFLTALALGEDYRASLTMFLSSPLTTTQIDRERRRADLAGLSFTVTNVVAREDIEAAAPPALAINMEGVGATAKTNTWTSSGWPTWFQPPSTYAFSDGRELEDGEAFPADSISAKDWKREYHQQWDSKKSLKDNLIQREDDAYFNAQLWMTPCRGLSLETLEGVSEGANVDALIQEVGDYQGPAALLRDVAEWLAGAREWRKAFRPVLDAAGWRE